MSNGKDDKDEIVELPDLSRVQGSLAMLPVQDAPRTGKNDLKVQRGPGRPRKVERAPQTSDLEYHAEMILQKERHIANDRVLQAVAKRLDPVEVLQLLKEEVAREASALEFNRLENEKRGKDTGQASRQRIDALLKIAGMELEMRKLGSDVIDLKSERMQRIYKLWVDAIKEVAADVLKAEQIDMFFNRLQTALEGWEDKAAEETTK